MDKFIITAAVTGAIHTATMSSDLPVTPNDRRLISCGPPNASITSSGPLMSSLSGSVKSA